MPKKKSTQKEQNTPLEKLADKARQLLKIYEKFLNDADHAVKDDLMNIILLCTTAVTEGGILLSEAEEYIRLYIEHLEKHKDLMQRIILSHIAHKQKGLTALLNVPLSDF